MKIVMTVIIAVLLLAVGIPLSRAIRNSDQHTITRTLDPARPGAQARAVASRHPQANPGTTTGASAATGQQAALER